MKNLFKRSVFLKLFMLLLAIGWSTSSVQAANTWWRVRVKAIHRDGTPAASYVAVWAIGGTAVTPSSNDYTMPSSSNVIGTNPNRAKVSFAVKMNNCESFQGWYKDIACTELLNDAFTASKWATEDLVSLYATSQAATEHVQTIYALFSDYCWCNQGDTPPTTGEYYIYNIGRGAFVGPGAYQYGSYNPKGAPDANNALLFTLTDGTTAGKKKLCATDGTTYCLKAVGSLGTDFTQEHTITAINDNTCCKVQLSNGNYWLMNTSGNCNNNATDDAATNPEKQWVFISKQAFLNNCKVKSKNSDGSALIDSPTGDVTPKSWTDY